MAVTTIDYDAEFKAIMDREFGVRARRIGMPNIRLWDGNWILRGRVTHFYSAEFDEIDLETGMGKIEMPEDYYLSKWIANHDDRSVKGIHITVDKDGMRWGGRMDHYEIEKEKTGRVVVRAYFKHDYEELHHILGYPNPFLPPELIQFPKVWLLFGTAKFCLKTTLFVNVFRLESSLWMIPDNPLNADEWLDTDVENWSMVVKPDLGEPDNTPLSFIYSRMKTIHDASKSLCEDSEMTWTFRRYLDGDDPPWSGANLRHGCLVIDVEDKSGWRTSGTAIGGSIFTGLIHAIANIADDGMTDETQTLPDPAWPDEYYEPGFLGTSPEAPGVVFREGEHTGIQTSLFVGTPAKDVQFVTGGQSMPGVNELISATIQAAGDFIAAMIGVPPVGGVADAILKPLYTNVFLAFTRWKDVPRAQSLGFSHYHERWAQGADRGFTLAAVLALRGAMWATRETFTHKLTVADGLRWRVGARGYGHFALGDRIGSTVRGTPKGKIYVDRVSELKLTIDRDKGPLWKVTIGQRKQEDPIQKVFEKIRELFGIARDLGVVG